MVLQHSRFQEYLDLVVELVLCDPLGITSSNNLQRDVSTLIYRFDHEGVSFLTKEMAQLGKALDSGISNQRFVCPTNWKKSVKYPSLPAFMQDYWKRVFDYSGLLLDDSSSAAVKHLRQVLFFCYKLELPYTEQQELDSISSYVATDASLVYPHEDPEAWFVMNHIQGIVGELFEDFDPKAIQPKHGPGGVATGEKLDEKWEFSRLYDNIHQCYPYYDYFIVGGARELHDRLTWYKSLERIKSGTTKFITVPKDSRGPRTICAEPLEYQYIQQGLSVKLVDHLESNRRTRGHINFSSQDVNRSLALQSSTTGEYDTIDLKDASDRVSEELVRKVFGRRPVLLNALLATRSDSTLLPDGSVIALRKFASMGSALCFPVEATVFWAIIVGSVSFVLQMQPELVGTRVFVYGDDIVVPHEWSALCIQYLELFGLRVNKDKCCTGPFFKESCGVDAFKGEVVTPIRLKKVWTGQKTDGSAYASYAAIANALSQRGYEGATSYIRALIADVYGPLPYGTCNSSYPCIEVNSALKAELLNKKLKFKCRVNRSLQRTEFLLKNVIPRKIPRTLDGWQRLLANMCSPRTVDPASVTVPRSVKIKPRWTLSS